MEELFVPVMSHFLNGNAWTGSEGRLRWRIVPKLEEAPEESTLTAEVWEGPWAYEFSTVEEGKTFPLSDDGREELRAWLTEWTERVEARPARTLEENIARKAQKTDPAAEEKP